MQQFGLSKLGLLVPLSSAAVATGLLRWHQPASGGSGRPDSSQSSSGDPVSHAGHPCSGSQLEWLEYGLGPVHGARLFPNHPESWPSDQLLFDSKCHRTPGMCANHQFPARRSHHGIQQPTMLEHCPLDCMQHL